jgi:NAD(P)-dependent dehydrogenase (short-subunit alcohol dehydrogenase family)
LDLELAGKTALVTGGTAGIGHAIALGLAQEGADVAICARTAADLNVAAAGIEQATGRPVMTVAADVSSRTDVDAMVDKVASRFGGLDILVNNAGIPGGIAKAPLETVEDDKVLLDLDVKYVGYLRCARAAVAVMKPRGWGRLIHIGGLGDLRGSAYSTGARNMAVMHLSRVLSQEYAPFGISSNVVHPGLTVTERIERRRDDLMAREGLSFDEAHTRVMTADNDYGRRISAKDVAAVAIFLASPRSYAITGESIGAGGGGRPALLL